MHSLSIEEEETLADKKRRDKDNVYKKKNDVAKKKRKIKEEKVESKAKAPFATEAEAMFKEQIEAEQREAK